MAQPVTVEPVTSGRATIRTSAGNVVLEFWPKEAPLAVRNFVQLALEGYYDGCQWHRIVPGLCVQTGDASNSGEGGDSIYDEGTFNDEFSNRLRFNRRGLVAMANAGKRHTNLSQCVRPRQLQRAMLIHMFKILHHPQPGRRPAEQAHYLCDCPRRYLLQCRRHQRV